MRPNEEKMLTTLTSKTDVERNLIHLKTNSQICR